MSDQVEQSLNYTNGMGRQTVQSYQSVWMAHWTRTSCNAAEETHSHDASGNKELDHANRDDNLTSGLEVSGPVKGLGVIETKTFKLAQETFKMSLKSMGNERMRSSLFKSSQDTDDMRAVRPVSGHNLEHGEAVASESGIQCPSLIPGIPSSFQGCHSLGKGTSKNPHKWMKTHSAGQYSNFAVPDPLQETLVESSSHIVPNGCGIEKYEFDKGKAAVSLLMSRSAAVSKQLPNANLRMLEHERRHGHNQLADLVCERKMNCSLQSDTYVNGCFRESDTCDHYLSTPGLDCFPKMHKCSGIRLFSSQCIASEKTQTRKSHNGCYSLQKLQNYVHDAETMRICNTEDSGDCPRFSQTTQSLLITKKTDVNLLKETDSFRSIGVISKINGNTSGDLHRLSPFFGQGKQGVKLQPLTSSIDDEAKEKAPKVTINNEISSETDTMDMDSFKENNSRNLQSSSYSTKSNKAFNMESNLPTWVGFGSSREVGCERQSIGPPGINLELPALPVAASPVQMCPNSSKTESLKMDKLLAQVEQPESKSNRTLDDCSNADPGNRWVKRLKLISSNNAQGTKSSNLTENSSHEKTSKFFSRILKSSITNSEPTQREQHGKESVLSDNGEDILKRDEDLMVDQENKGEGLLLSHAWIRRWLHDGSRINEKKPETMVVYEPQSLRLALGNFQREQFPSIAAMALMGRAMTGFQQCELKKRGPFTVWNTKGI